MKDFKQDVENGSLELAIIDYLSDGKALTIEELFDYICDELYPEINNEKLYQVFGDYNYKNMTVRSFTESGHKYKMIFNGLDNTRSMITALYMLFVFNLDKDIDYVYAHLNKNIKGTSIIRFFDSLDLQSSGYCNEFKDSCIKCKIEKITIERIKGTYCLSINIICTIDGDNTVFVIYPAIYDYPSQFNILYEYDEIMDKHEPIIFGFMTPVCPDDIKYSEDN